MEKILAHLAPVGETVERVRSALDPSTTLIGFAGSPGRWASTPSKARGGTDKSDARKFEAISIPAELAGMLDQLVEASAHYLCHAGKAGA